jgi:putative membrane protein
MNISLIGYHIVTCGGFMNRLTVLLLAFTAGTTAVYAADDVSPHTSHGESAVKAEVAEAVKSSEAFAKTAAQSSMKEVELGKLAATRASDKKVKEFAQRMVADHSKANAELRGIAKSKNILLPAHLEAKHQAVVDELKNTPAVNFDAAYAKMMAKDHDKSVALMEKASTAKDLDPMLQSFAKRTLPTIEEHRELAKDLAAKVQVRKVQVSSTTPAR